MTRAPGAKASAEPSLAASEPTNTVFGNRRVPLGAKAGLVRDVFQGVASKYDLMNDLMSGGVHRLWKAEMVDWLNPRPGIVLADIAGGTGDIAFRVLERARAGTITVVDASPAMLEVGRDRALDRGIVEEVRFVG